MTAVIFVGIGALVAFALGIYVSRHVNFYEPDNLRAVGQNLIHVLPFFIAIYLMFVAIAATSFLDQVDSIHDNEEANLKQLLSSKGKDIPETYHVPQILTDDQIQSSIDELIGYIHEDNLALTSFMQITLRKLKYLFASLQERPKQFPAKIDTERDNILEKFQLQYHNFYEKPDIESYKQTLVETVDHWIAEWKLAVGSCGQSIEYTQARLMDLISDTLSTIKSFNLAKNADINNTIINYPYYDPANLRLDSLEKSCDIDFVLEQEIVPNQDSRPKPPNSEFGIPTIMQLVGVKWLTQTESRDLVLLVGVIGFGLFGTLVKPFVRGERSRSRRNYIGGMSAAIIVYLLSIGGLAIFTQGAAPKPYAIYVASLVAAVYSEEVWRWVRNRQSGQLNSREPPSGQGR
jgi:hypothetical protein